MAVSRFAALTDAILSTLRASTDAGLTGVEIVDGPPFGADVPPKAVFIGWTGGDEDDTAGTISQSVHDAGLGASAKRDETVVVECIAEVFTGDDDLSAPRTTCVAILGAVESALRADYSLGLADVLRVEIDTGEVLQSRGPNGAAVRIGFRVSATCLI